jgi:hypothetical protein
MLMVVGRVVGTTALARVVATAAVGENSASANLAPTAVYITFWVGLTFVSFLVGDLWRALNPFDTLARLGDGSRGPGAGRRSEDLGYWPASAVVLGFVWLELVYPDRSEPRVLAVAIAAYSVAVLAAGAVWGRGWVRGNEGFTVLFDLLGHAAPLGRSGDGTLRLRPPLAGLATVRPARGLDVLVLVLLGSTTFDGLTRTQWWADLSAQTSGVANTLLGTVGLLWAIGMVAVVYVGAMRVTARLTGAENEPSELSRAFAHSLVPMSLLRKRRSP